MQTRSSVPKHILPLIIIAQFCCTSVWFATNAVSENLLESIGVNTSYVSHLTSAVQIGFIIGTLTFALFSISDRYSPSKVFLASALLSGLFNACILLPHTPLLSLLIFRVLTGFFLAGIYPVGMKIAADYFSHGLGKSLGFLVGALVLGTALPHLVHALNTVLPWTFVITTTSLLSVVGGTLVAVLVPDGPYRKPALKIDFTQIGVIFKNKGLRQAAFGYFGHMWELYAFWTFVPLILTYQANHHPLPFSSVAFWSFIIIATGFVSCAISGILAANKGTKFIAFVAVSTSGICCLISPIILIIGNFYLLLIFLIIWGMSVIADSPLFSTLIAQNATQNAKGTALTIINCVGYAITVLSIQLLSFLHTRIPFPYLFLVLSMGPIFAVFNLTKNFERSSKLSSFRHE